MKLKESNFKDLRDKSILSQCRFSVLFFSKWFREKILQLKKKKNFFKCF